MSCRVKRHLQTSMKNAVSDKFFKLFLSLCKKHHVRSSKCLFACRKEVRWDHRCEMTSLKLDTRCRLTHVDTRYEIPRILKCKSDFRDNHEHSIDQNITRTPARLHERLIKHVQTDRSRRGFQNRVTWSLPARTTTQTGNNKYSSFLSSLLWFDAETVKKKPSAESLGRNSNIWALLERLKRAKLLSLFQQPINCLQLSSSSSWWLLPVADADPFHTAVIFRSLQSTN